MQEVVKQSDSGRLKRVGVLNKVKATGRPVEPLGTCVLLATDVLVLALQ